jgi:hypothetical protein
VTDAPRMLSISAESLGLVLTDLNQMRTQLGENARAALESTLQSTNLLRQERAQHNAVRESYIALRIAVAECLGLSADSEDQELVRGLQSRLVTPEFGWWKCPACSAINEAARQVCAYCIPTSEPEPEHSPATAMLGRNAGQVIGEMLNTGFGGPVAATSVDIPSGEPAAAVEPVDDSATSPWHEPPAGQTAAPQHEKNGEARHDG